MSSEPKPCPFCGNAPVDLDSRMKAAGMIPLSDLINGNTPLERWQAHTGVSDLATFEQWLEMRQREIGHMKAGYALGDKSEEDELFEWVNAHFAALNEVAANLRQMKRRMAEASPSPAYAEPGIKAMEWIDGHPTKHWADEWFIAETTYGDRVVLRSLPEEWAYDFKTADDTYIKADRIKRWMQFPDSEFKPAPGIRSALVPTTSQAKGGVGGRPDTPTPWDAMDDPRGRLVHVETALGNPAGAGLPICSIPVKRKADALFIIEAANAFAALRTSAPVGQEQAKEGVVEQPDPEYISGYLDGVVGVVEANSFESMCLWKEWHQDGGKPWVDNCSGLLPIIGWLAGMPVTLSLFTKVVDGHKLLFIDPPSQVVDHRLIEGWLKLALPKSSFREGCEYINKTDAMNFHNVFRRALQPSDPISTSNEKEG